MERKVGGAVAGRVKAESLFSARYTPSKIERRQSVQPHTLARRKGKREEWEPRGLGRGQKKSFFFLPSRGTGMGKFSCAWCTLTSVGRYQRFVGKTTATGDHLAREHVKKIKQ